MCRYTDPFATTSSTPNTAARWNASLFRAEPTGVADRIRSAASAGDGSELAGNALGARFAAPAAPAPALAGKNVPATSRQAGSSRTLKPRSTQRLPPPKVPDDEAAIRDHLRAFARRRPRWRWRRAAVDLRRHGHRINDNLPKRRIAQSHLGATQNERTAPVHRLS